MKKYVTVSETNETDAHVFETLKEANAYAEMRWNHLTVREQKKSHVYVGWETEEDLFDGAIDEETGEIDWAMWGVLTDEDGAFDSDIFYAVQYTYDRDNSKGSHYRDKALEIASDMLTYFVDEIDSETFGEGANLHVDLVKINTRTGYVFESQSIYQSDICE